MVSRATLVPFHAFLDTPQTAVNAQRVYGGVTHRAVVGMATGTPAPMNSTHAHAGAVLQNADPKKRGCTTRHSAAVSRFFSCYVDFVIQQGYHTHGCSNLRQLPRPSGPFLAFVSCTAHKSLPETQVPGRNTQSSAQPQQNLRKTSH